MSFHHFLLITLATFLVSTRAVLAAKKTKVSLLNHGVVTGRDGTNLGRSLRLANTYDKEDGSEEDLTEEEERNNPISSFVSKISDKIPLWVKLPVWLERRKSAEYVKNKLGMEGLTGTSLKNHKNYPRLVKYIDDLEENELWTLARNGFYSTFKMWNRMKLNTGPVSREGMAINQINAQLQTIKGTESYRIYKRFSIAFDDHMLNLFGSGYYRPTKFIDKDASPIEIFARTEIWAEKGVRAGFVKEFFGMRWKKESKACKNIYYQYYLAMLQKPKASC